MYMNTSRGPDPEAERPNTEGRARARYCLI